MVESVDDLEQKNVFLRQRRKHRILPPLSFYVVHRKLRLGQEYAVNITIPESKPQFDCVRSMRLVLFIIRGRYRSRWHQEYKFVRLVVTEKVSSLLQYGLCQWQGLMIDQVVEIALVA
jgi:hypothetical protein